MASCLCVQVNTWVAIGCPFGGAPGFGVDALFTGVQWAGSLGSYFFVARTTFRQVGGGVGGWGLAGMRQPQEKL